MNLTPEEIAQQDRDWATLDAQMREDVRFAFYLDNRRSNVIPFARSVPVQVDQGEALIEVLQRLTTVLYEGIEGTLELLGDINENLEAAANLVSENLDTVNETLVHLETELHALRTSDR